MRVYVLAGLVAAAVLYGSSYQQFRFFNPADPGGATDALHYMAMAQGAPVTEPEIRQYRWLTPGAAHLLMPITSAMTTDGDLSVRLAFYIVNYTFSLIACIALFATLQLLGFPVGLSLLGICAIASSRVMVLVTGTPLVDAGYFCVIAVLIYLTVAEKGAALALLMPALASSKETILPFLMLPLLTRLRTKWYLWAGYAAAAAVLAARARLTGPARVGEDASMPSVIWEHVAEVSATASRLLTLGGWHDLQHGFSFLLLLAAAGVWLNARHRYRAVPLVVVATVPLAFGLALLSGNMGRMFFAAFPAVIVYALITVEHVISPRAVA